MNLIKKVFSKFKNKKFYISTLVIFSVLLITFFVTRTKAVTPANPAFDDYNFYKCVVYAYNKTNNSQESYNTNLNDSQLQTITKLNCMKRQDTEKIQSVKGLEKLINIEFLNLNGNEISDIDIAKNNKIKYLYLSNNDLNNINVSQNINLLELNLSSNNLNEIDISQNINLLELNLSSNNLNEINLENNIELTRLYVVSNNLNAINLSNNSKLVELQLSRNKLNEIDLQQNINLKNLFLRHNNIETIDLRNNSNLEVLCLDDNKLNLLNISNNKNLLHLRLSVNNIKTIDLHNNSNLEYLDLSSNELQNLDLTSNKNLKSLEVGGTTSIERNQLLSLNLSNNTSLLKTGHFVDRERGLCDFLSNESSGCGGFIYEMHEMVSERNFNLMGENNVYKLNLKEYDSNLDPSKVEFTPIDGVTYDSQTGIFTLTKKIATINYVYKTGAPSQLEELVDLSVELALNYPPKIKTFYVGGNSNPKYATSTASSIYLDWDDTDVTQYCISSTNSSSGCSWKSTSGNSVTADYKLTTNDGTKTLYAFLKNTDNVISEEKSDEIILDTTAPTIDTFYVGGQTNPEYATSTTSSIYLTWNDDDVKQYCVTTTNNNVGCHWTTTNGNSVSETYTLTGSNGTKRVYAYIKDEAGHISAVKEDSIILDTIKPTIDKFYVGGSSNPEYVTDANTTIYLTWNDEDVVSYCVNTSNSTSGCNWQNTSNKSITASYTLTGSNGTKTLYAYIKDRAGNISSVKEDGIVLDSTKPIIETFYIGGSSNPEYATDTNSTVYLTWQDNDVTDYCISTTNSSNNCEWLKTSGKNVNAEYILQGKNGEITLYAFIKDSAGLISNSKMDKITLSTTKPLIETFYIGGNNNPKYATSTSSSVYLKWSEENITDYCISATNSSDDCDWKNVSEKSINASYTLANGDGTKRLYAYIKNAAGLISNVASDNIILDTTKPTIDKFYIGGNNNPKYINSKDTNIYATWQDNDVVSYCLSEENSSENCKWENLSGKVLNTTYSLTSENGEKKLYLYIKDEAEHTSEVKEDSVILDTKIPVIKEFYIADKGVTKITDNKTKITIIHEEEDVESYCISETNSYLLCNWIKSKDKKIEAEYTLPIGNGSKTLYAFIKDEAGNISLLKLAKIELEMPLTNLNNPNENNVDTPLNSSPQTGAITIGVITIVGMLIGLTYYIILKRRNKIYKL